MGDKKSELGKGMTLDYIVNEANEQTEWRENKIRKWIVTVKMGGKGMAGRKEIL